VARLPMAHRNVKPDAAKSLLEGGEGWIYLDVRTEEEFRDAHAVGARNSPVMVRDSTGRMAPNPGFVAQAKKMFPVDARLLVGCASGVRSLRACDLLAAEGYAHLANLSSGFHGRHDATGRVVEPGWQACGYPCE